MSEVIDVRPAPSLTDTHNNPRVLLSSGCSQLYRTDIQRAHPDFLVQVSGAKHCKPVPPTSAKFLLPRQSKCYFKDVSKDAEKHFTGTSPYERNPLATREPKGPDRRVGSEFHRQMIHEIGSNGEDFRILTLHALEAVPGLKPGFAWDLHASLLKSHGYLLDS
jgi:hypothetical protein